MAGNLYRIKGSDPADLGSEINGILQKISDRLDKIEGYRGSPEVWSKQVNKDDVVLENSGTGVVLKDGNTPPNYWRVTIDNAGALVQTNLGREY